MDFDINDFDREIAKRRFNYNPKVTQKKKIILVGMDFFGNPYEKAGGWFEQNAIGQLWKRFESFYQNKKDSIKHSVSESGYELWIDFEEEKETKKNTSSSA